MTSPNEVLSLNTSDHIWAGDPLSHQAIKRIRKVVARDPKSKDFETQVKQKQLYRDMAEMLPSFRRSGQPGDWKNLMEFLNGPEPMNPIFKGFLKTHEPVDVKDEEHWKLWCYSVDAYQRGQSSQAEEEPAAEDGEDYFNPDEDSVEEKSSEYGHMSNTWSEHSEEMRELELHFNKTRKILTEGEEEMMDEIDETISECGCHQ